MRILNMEGVCASIRLNVGHHIDITDEQIISAIERNSVKFSMEQVLEYMRDAAPNMTRARHEDIALFLQRAGVRDKKSKIPTHCGYRDGFRAD